LATPIASLKSALSVSARIASNYHPHAKFLYIDGKRKCIKYKKPKKSKVDFIANAELLKQPATTEEELMFVEQKEYGHAPSPQLMEKIHSRTKCFYRYMTYIQEEIGLENIAPIRQYWITDILELIPGDFEYLEKEVVEQMLDYMLTEITADYYTSCKKSILDYVLQDEKERLRIGIV